MTRYGKVQLGITRRYLIAGSLYSKGLLSGEQARQLTGDVRRAFEEKLTLARQAHFGFPIMPDHDDDIRDELEA